MPYYSPILVLNLLLLNLFACKGGFESCKLKILDSNKSAFEELNLTGKAVVDKRIINYAKENPQMLVATLDTQIKKATPNPKLVIRAKKKLEII